MSEDKNVYQIHVKCYLDPSWSNWFDKWTINHISDNDTILTSPRVDREALQAVLNKITGDLNLPLISVMQLDGELQWSEENVPKM